MKNPKEQIDQLIITLKKWSKEYYESDNPSVSDAQYDGSYNKFKLILIIKKLDNRD